MIIMSSLKVAQEMEVPRTFAVNARQRYITQRFDEIDNELSDMLPWLERMDVNAAFLSKPFMRLMVEKSRLSRELSYMKTIMDRKQTITDEMIETARNHPVTNLVEFRRGKATAWCHDDKNPSLFFGSRTNRAVCPVCDRKFGPIDVLMTRDGMTFVEAVKFLSI